MYVSLMILCVIGGSKDWSESSQPRRPPPPKDVSYYIVLKHLFSLLDLTKLSTIPTSDSVVSF